MLTAWLWTACTDTASLLDSPEVEFGEGEAVLFTTSVPRAREHTRALSPDATLLSGYKTIQDDYELTVKMYEEGRKDVLGSCTYHPATATVPTPENKGYDEDGLLKPSATETQLYWPSNVKKYAFEASAGTQTLEADQSTEEKWLAQDRLHGYAYMPLLDDTKAEGQQQVDHIDAPNYHTNREWGAMNKAWRDATGQMLQPDDYKRIPLFLQHQRAWITIILKAGEGVKREALDFATAATNIKSAINSYAAGQSGATVLAIDQPLASEHRIDYEKDANGEAAKSVSTTRYDAIVEPYNYGGDRKELDAIAKINLSNQNFTFYASNDTRYVNGTAADKAAADEVYNLQAGKHLTITVTLSRESRKILITAWIEDWTEVVTSTICDDYGQNGDPIVIKNRDELIAFLTDPKKNTQGSVAIIQPTPLNLDDAENPWGKYDLNATLNLAGCKLVTSQQLFQKMSSSANLVNGTVEITDNATLDCAIASKNEGTIERVNVVTSGEESQAKATLAGMVGLNNGTIYQCTSTLPVYGTTATSITMGNMTYTGYVGGIAAVSLSKDDSSLAVIDGCTVNASVNGTAAEGEGGTAIKGGGIVGYATGRVSNNTFEYGITILQDEPYFKNIFGLAGSSDLRAYGNGWPTKSTNYINATSTESNKNSYTGTLYDAVIESQGELDHIMKTPANNAEGMYYRLSKSFAVTSSNTEEDNWTHGTADSNDDGTGSVNNVSFHLDGNDKTITLTGTKTVKTTNGTNSSEGDVTTYTTAPMLFNCVLGEIKNLTLYLDNSIVAKPSEKTDEKSNKTSYSAEDAIAPLAYAVKGGTLSNIKVKAHKDDKGNNDVFVQAATPAGLVVWAYENAKISNCKVQVPVRMWLPTQAGTQSKHYAGGIVACAARASITESTYMVNSDGAVSGATESANTSANHFYGGIVGGTSIKNSEPPSLQIADCTSWFNATNTGKTSKGAIIAMTCYAAAGSDSQLTNGMSQTEKSEGNWWQTNAIGAHTLANGLTEEKVIGKRNAVEPSYDNNF